MNPLVLMKFLIQRNLRKLGWEIRRYERTEVAKLVKFFELHKIRSVMDVGANIGQFATELRLTGYQGQIVSFEPQSDAHAKLIQQAKSDQNWIVAPRCAVGSLNGDIELNISHNSVSSSVLPILDQHTRSAPSSSYVRTERVPLIRLDDCELLNASIPTFIKIDTQGFEQNVIEGAQQALALVKGVQMEMSLAPLYEGQGNLLTLLSRMSSHGFEIWSVSPGFADPKTGRVLQIDATFFRPPD